MIKFKKNSPYSFKRVLYLIICAIAVAVYFWTQSRYPALNKKAMMGGRSNIAGIVFDILYPVFEQDNFLLRIGKSTMNWYYTNWKGMTFGLIFSGLVLSILSMYRFKGFKNSYMNALMGFIFGAPLGVCANCAAPISRSIYESTRSIEASLATLFSSPTFNIVVLTMSFSLLPFEFAITKLFLSLLLIFFVTPILGKYFKNAPEHLCNIKEDIEQIPSAITAQISVKESWPVALLESIKLFSHSFVFIIVKTIPAMLLAGLIGSVAIELVPIDNLISMPLSFLGVFSVAFLGTFLPVPMSFDVVAVTILLNSGLHPTYAMTLLFTLGIFSIYPFMVLWKAINKKLAFALFTIVMVLGMLGGMIAPLMVSKNNQNLISKYKLTNSDPVHEIRQDLKSTCLKLGNPLDIDCVFNVARGIGSREICSVLTNEGSREICYARLYGLNLKYDDCSNYEKVEYIIYCFEGFQRRTFNSKIQLNRFCDNKNQDTQTCKNIRIAKLVNSEKINEIKRCEAVNTFQEYRYCLDLVLKNLEDNIHFSHKECELLNDPKNKAYCSYSLALSKNANISREIQEKTCSQWSREDIKSMCNQFFLTYLSIKTGKCDELNSTMKPICYSKTFSNKLISKFYNLIGDSNLQSRAGVDEEIDNFKYKSPSVIEPILAKTIFKLDDLKISSFEFKKRIKNKKSMTRYEANDLGLSIPDMSFLQGIDLPLRRSSNSVSAGDFDSDGYQDLVFSTERGPYLFRNLGDLKFELVKINTDKIFLKDYQLSGVSFIDINNDGLLDLFFFSKKNENYFIINLDGKFGKTRIESLPEFPNKLYLQTVSFADVDKDGFVDIFLGFNPPWGLANPSEMAENILLKRSSTGWSHYKKYEDRIKYLSMSSLFSDINQDGNMDLWIGTDLILPDQLLMGEKGGGFREILKSDKIVSDVPDNSMSYDSADINNDLILDVFGIGVGYNPESASLFKGNYCQFITTKADQDKCNSLEKKWSRLKDASYSSCFQLEVKSDQADCIGYFIYRKAIILKEPKQCNNFLDGSDLKDNCLAVFKYENNSLKPYRKKAEDLNQVTHNVLLVQDKNAKFKEQAKAWGVADTGWGWNAKFADYNNDKFNDLYVSNGYLIFRVIGKNFLFINKNGKKFEDKTKEFGIEEVYSSYSNVAVDLLNDGNLSIVSTANNGPTRIYINHNDSNSIEFELRQNPKLGNTSAIGARIIIKDNSGVSQIREIKASGGFLSFGPYVQHFGLGKDSGIKEVKIVWPDGSVSNIKKEFAADHRYLIER